MKRMRGSQQNIGWKMGQKNWAFLLVVFFWLGGCSIWNSYLHPDYESTRADRLCHPYGECSQGTWVAADGSTKDVREAKTQCHEEVEHRRGDEWWKHSVSRGLEIGSCLEEKGYTLQQ